MEKQLPPESEYDNCFICGNPLMDDNDKHVFIVKFKNKGAQYVCETCGLKIKKKN